MIAADTPFEQVFPLGEELARMTVAEFYARFADELPDDLPMDKKTLIRSLERSDPIWLHITRRLDKPLLRT